MDEYISRIIAEFNKHAQAADAIAADPKIGNLFEEGFHAFMANAISSAVYKHANTSENGRKVFERFQAEAIH